MNDKDNEKAKEDWWMEEKRVLRLKDNWNMQKTENEK